MTYLRDLAACYLILTLAATGLAKLRRWRTVSVVLIRDSVLPRSVVPAVVFGISAVELLLAVLLAIGVELRYTSAIVLALFVVFGIYRIVAAYSSKSLSCGCSGAERTYDLNGRTLVATILATACQAVAAIVLIFTYKLGISDFSVVASLAALAAPLGALVVGQVRSRLRHVGLGGALPALPPHA